MENIIITFIIIIGGLGLSIFLCTAGIENACYEKYKPVITYYANKYSTYVVIKT